MSEPNVFGDARRDEPLDQTNPNPDGSWKWAKYQMILGEKSFRTVTHPTLPPGRALRWDKERGCIVMYSPKNPSALVEEYDRHHTLGEAHPSSDWKVLVTWLDDELHRDPDVQVAADALDEYKREGGMTLAEIEANMTLAGIEAELALTDREAGGTWAWAKERMRAGNTVTNPAMDTPDGVKTYYRLKPGKTTYAGGLNAPDICLVGCSADNGDSWVGSTPGAFDVIGRAHPKGWVIARPFADLARQREQTPRPDHAIPPDTPPIRDNSLDWALEAIKADTTKEAARQSNMARRYRWNEAEKTIETRIAPSSTWMPITFREIEDDVKASGSLMVDDWVTLHRVVIDPSLTTEEAQKMQRDVDALTSTLMSGGWGEDPDGMEADPVPPPLDRGEWIVCPKGHRIAQVLADFYDGMPNWHENIGNWRIPEAMIPKPGDIPSPCPKCGEHWFDGANESRPIMTEADLLWKPDPDQTVKEHYTNSTTLDPIDEDDFALEEMRRVWAVEQAVRALAGRVDGDVIIHSSSIITLAETLRCYVRDGDTD